MEQLGTPDPPPRIGRRTALFGGAVMGAVPAVVAGTVLAGPTFVTARDRLMQGARTGEVTTSSAVLWSRGVRDGRLLVELSSNGRLLREIRGPWTDARTDYCGRVVLEGLAPGREYAATLWFASPDGTQSTRERVTFRTAPIHNAAQSFVWSGDCCGQGYGINPELGGLRTFGAMLDVQPDFFVHCGDNIYADGVMEETLIEPDGRVWRNELTESVTRVAETLQDYRGRHRYLLGDEHVRALFASVPTISMWDDHETIDNWYPGELHSNEAYTEKRVDVLTLRGRRAWQEYQPVPVRRLVRPGGDGFALDRIYRSVPRGQHLEVFVLDMRTHRGPNATADRVGEPGLLGETQERWLIDALTRSRATWKVISSDLPLSILATPDDLDTYANADDGRPFGRESELARVLSAIKRRGIRNVVWITADVHYTAAHAYAPERATFTDFDPFWEFVSGPLAAGTFIRHDELDQTFGPQVVFSKGNDTGADMSPRAGNQFFGHMAIDADGVLTVSLMDVSGATLWSTVLEPDDVRPRRQGAGLDLSGVVSAGA